MWIELHTANERKLSPIKHARYKLDNGSMGVFAGLGVDDLDVDLHEVGWKGVVLNFTPTCGLDHLVFVAYAWV